MCSAADDPTYYDRPRCRCWNPARPMPTRDARLHQADCPVGRAQMADAKRLLADAMRKFQR